MKLGEDSSNTFSLLESILTLLEMTMEYNFILV